ncbi:hypothetical protein FNF27_01486 [Cafeteria roenbergensis]|uniref:Uncharacterized protein n=1 Tax=Cafeteria roenbergensis TaxID=33653 RepID=A0A5A8EGZ8_CAFRO|nr:hypothetical protein FNF27_01486 [Cafeteria roenbergensis]
MQLVQSTPAAAAAGQLQQFPEMVEAERSIRTGKAPAAAILLERVAEVTGMALGNGSDMHVAALRRLVSAHCVSGNFSGGEAAIRKLEAVTRMPQDPEGTQATGSGLQRHPFAILQDRMAVIWSGLVLFARQGNADRCAAWSDELLVLAHSQWGPAVKGGGGHAAWAEDDEDVLARRRACWVGLAHLGGALAARLQQAAGDGASADAMEEHDSACAQALVPLAGTSLEPLASLLLAAMGTLVAEGAAGASEAAVLRLGATPRPSVPAGERAAASATDASVCLGDAWELVLPLAEAAKQGLFRAGAPGGAGGAAAGEGRGGAEGLAAGDEAPAVGFELLSSAAADGLAIASVVGAELAAVQLAAGSGVKEGLILQLDGTAAGAAEGEAGATRLPAPGVLAGMALTCASSLKDGLASANDASISGASVANVVPLLPSAFAQALMAEALTAAGEAHHHDGKAVHGEGLFNSAMDDGEAATAASKAADAATAAALLRARMGKARLAADWEKREAEGEKLAAAAMTDAPTVAPPAIALALDWGFSGDWATRALNFNEPDPDMAASLGGQDR